MTSLLNLLRRILSRANSSFVKIARVIAAALRNLSRRLSRKLLVRFASLAFLTSIVALSLWLAAWIFGIADDKTVGRALHLEITFYCLNSGSAEFRVESQIASRKLDLLDRFREEIPKDSVKIEFRTFEDANFEKINTDVLLQKCANPVEIRSNLEISDFWDGLGRNINARDPLVAVVPGYNYAIDPHQIFTFGQGSGFISFGLKESLMDEQGLGGAEFEQSVRVSGLYGGVPTILLSGVVSVPHRYDDIRLSPGSYIESGASNIGEFRNVVEVVKFVQKNEMVKVGNFDRRQEESILVLKCSDSRMKNLEQMLLFCAAAVFGTAIGGLFELVIAYLKK